MSARIVERIRRWVDDLIESRATTGGTFVENFDGLRAVAALAVFVHHLEILPHFVLGPVGVWLFFALSGYLLYSGFMQIKGVPDSRNITSYLTRRIFRILPLYLVVVLAMAYVFGYTTESDTAHWTLEHALFVRADHHLWTVKTEMMFYLALPVLALVLYPVRSDLARLALLTAAGVLAWWVFEDQQWFPMQGATAFFTPFLFGMAAFHLRGKTGALMGHALVAASLMAIALFSSDFEWGRPLREWLGLYSLSDLWEFGFLFYLPCAALVLGVSRIKSAVWGNRWLRLIGVCGYGFYLWHWPVVITVTAWQLPVPLYVLTCFVMTMSLSLLTYVFIEHPGINAGRRVSRWIREDRRLFGWLRPVSVCAVLIPVFFLYRYSVGGGTTVDFRIELQASQVTTVKIFLDSGDGFNLRHMGGATVQPNAWQTVTLHVPEVRIHQIRLDPSESGGEIKIRSISVRYPYHGRWHNLDMSRFQPLIGIRGMNHEAEYLHVVTQPNHPDPMLLYSGAFHQPWLKTRTLAWILLVPLMVLSLLLFRSIDRLTLRGDQAPAS